MKRKYLSALLMGALTVTSVSTFTSCKDYDNDISNLQGQIDKAALSTDVQTLKGQVETAASNASSAIKTAENALATANNLDSDLAALEEEVQENASNTADALARLAGNESALADSIAALQKKSQAAADSAASAIAKNKQLSDDLAAAIKSWGESKDGYYTAKDIDAKLDSLADVIAQASDDSIASLKKVVNGYKDGINALYTAVTGVSLIVDNSYLTSSQGNYRYSPNLYFVTGKVTESRTFGAKEVDDKNGEHSATPTCAYTKDASVNFPTEILVRVNPVNAQLKPSMIKLVDSKGNDLDNILEVTSVKAYDELIRKYYDRIVETREEVETRASSKSGLWVVSLQVKSGVKADDVEQSSQEPFDSFHQYDDDDKLYHETGYYKYHTAFAVAVNNTADQAETAKDAADRYVVSEYGLTVRGTSDFKAANNLDWVKVAAESKSADETAWKQIQTLNPNYGSSSTLAVSNGENILLDFSEIYMWGSDNNKYCPIDRFYVVLDKSHAGENEDSQTSEINAWNSYSYTGLNTIASAEKGGKISVKINGQVGDEVQFRIFAVNYDGTLVEKNGRAFRVYVGAETTQTSATGTLKATAANYMTTDWVKIDGTLKNGGDIGKTGTVTMVTTDNKKVTVNYYLSTDGKSTAGSTANLSDCKYIKFDINNGDNNVLTTWADGTEATGSLHDTDNSKTYVNNITVKLTKQLPTGADAKSLVKYTWKDKQLDASNTYTAYLYPLGDQWDAQLVSAGYKDMSKAITGMTGSCYVEVENADLEYGADGKQYFTKSLVTSSVSGYSYSDKTLWVENDPDAAGTRLIDNTTKHKSYVKYNFGKISSAAADKDYVVSMEEFNTVFACPLATSAQTYSWEQIAATKTSAAKNVNELTYGSTATVDGVNLLKYIKGKNSFDNTVFGGSLSALFNKYYKIEGELISAGSKKQDYFKVKKITANGIEFEKNSDATNPQSNVASYLVLKMYDVFGHENVYELPFTVKRAE